MEEEVKVHEGSLMPQPKKSLDRKPTHRHQTQNVAFLVSKHQTFRVREKHRKKRPHGSAEGKMLKRGVVNGDTSVSSTDRNYYQRSRDVSNSSSVVLGGSYDHFGQGQLTSGRGRRKSFASRYCHKHLNLWVSIAIGFAFLSIGMLNSLVGLITFDLQLQAKTTSFMATFFFSAFGLGHLLGSLLAARVLETFPRASYRLLSVFLLLLAVAAGTLPRLNHIWMVYTALLSMGMTVAWVDNCGNALEMMVFGSYTHILVQVSHVCYGVGAISAPLILAVSKQFTITYFDTLWITAGFVVVAALINLSLAIFNIPSRVISNPFQSPIVENAAQERSATTFYKSFQTESYRGRENRERRGSMQTVVFVFTAVLLFIFAGFHATMLMWFHRYLTPELTAAAPPLALVPPSVAIQVPSPLVPSLGDVEPPAPPPVFNPFKWEETAWPIDRSGVFYLMSFYWGVFSLGRPLGIFLARSNVSIPPVIIFSSSFLLAAAVVMSFVLTHSIALLYAIVGIIAISLTTLFPATLSLPTYAGIHWKFSDSLVLTTGMGLGEMLIPLIFAQIMFWSRPSAMWVLLGAGLFSVVVSLVGLIYFIVKNKQTGRRRTTGKTRRKTRPGPRTALINSD